MEIVLENLGWISENIALAFLGVVFGWAFLYMEKKYLRAFLFLLWLLFLPNTIYLVTDIQYLPAQWQETDIIARLALLIQYVTLFSLGIISFLLALYPFEKVLFKFRKNDFLVLGTLLVLNFLVAFAVALGKFQRVNSWEVFTEPSRVLISIQVLLSSPDTVTKIVIFGIFCNILYLSLRHTFKLNKLHL